MRSFYALEEEVLAWANARKIIDVDAHRQMYLQVLRTQCLKLTEEVGELNGAIWRKQEQLGNESAIIDAVGDILVVMTSLVWALPPLVYKDEQEQLRYRLTDLYEVACDNKDTCRGSLLLLNNEVGALAASIIKNKPGDNIRVCMYRVVYFLKHVCYEYVPLSSLVECYEEAYNVIKERKGKTTADGNFIKEGD